MEFMRNVHTLIVYLKTEIQKKKGNGSMNRKLIIDGTAVYEVDEECMLKKRLDEEEKSRYENGQTMKASAQGAYMEEYKKTMRDSRAN